MARSKFLVFILSFIFYLMNSYVVAAPSENRGFDIAKIEKLMGKIGQSDPNEQAYKIIIPRDDFKIVMSGVQIASDRGLSSHIYFKKTNNHTSVRGDFILLQDQVNPVMSIALTRGLQVVGLNNPYLWDSPRVMVMRIQSEGSSLQLASAVVAVLKKIRDTMNGNGDFPLGSLYLTDTVLDTHKIDSILGVRGKMKENSYQVKWNDKIKKTDAEINKTIAANTWAAFSGSDDHALVNGSIVTQPSELQKTLITLRNAQVYILAIYNYPVDDEQNLVAINFLGIGKVRALAKIIRSTFLVAQNTDSSQQATGLVAEALAVNAEKEAGMTPGTLSLFRNKYCGYANENALYTSIEAKNNRPVPVVSPTLSKLADAKQNILFSARAILSRLSVIKNNTFQMVLLSHPFNKGRVEIQKQQAVLNPVAMVHAPAPTLSNSSRIKQELPFSAKAMLAKLSSEFLS